MYMMYHPALGVTKRRQDQHTPPTHTILVPRYVFVYTCMMYNTQIRRTYMEYTYFDKALITGSST